MTTNPTEATPLVSVIIPSWNRKGELRECLESIQRQDYPSLEIIVVDESSDGTVDMLRTEYPHVRVIANQVAYGVSYCRNQAILASRGTYLLFLDSDIEFPTTGTIATMVTRFQGDPAIGELGSEIAVFAGEKDQAFGKGLTRGGYAYRIPVGRNAPAITACVFLATCNCMVRREIALQVGGFDPYCPGCEDVDFALAISKAGYTNYAAFDCAVYHRASTTGRHIDQSYRNCVGRVRFLTKHFGLVRTLFQFLWDLWAMTSRRLKMFFARVWDTQGEPPASGDVQYGSNVLFKAYVDSLRHLPAMMRARHANFLGESEMAAFRAWHAKEQGNAHAVAVRIPVAPRVSAIIPTWNRCDELKACINSLKTQQDIELEIIVVDDGSGDETPTVVRAQYPEVVLLGDRNHYGPAFRRNQGILASHGDYLLHLDSDIEFPNNLVVRHMVEELNQNPKLGSVGGEIGLNLESGKRNHAWGLRLKHKKYPERVAALPGDGLVPCDYLASLNCMTRREVALQVGGFDSYFEFGGPDMDFGFRIKEAGYINAVKFECAALHKAATTGRRPDVTYRYCLGSARFMLRHRGPVAFGLRVVWLGFRLTVNRILEWIHKGLAPEAGTGRSHRVRADEDCLFRAYFWHLRHFLPIRKTFAKNFLATAAMQRFQDYKRRTPDSSGKLICLI